jgi:uncharacterized membrane protein YcaP (DUF421 family)
LLRAGNKRFHLETAFDIIFIIIIGSILSRAINGSSTLLQAIVAGLGMVILHWIFAFLCWYSPFLNRLIKGTTTILIHNGELKWENLKRNLITQDDLRERSRDELHNDKNRKNYL